MTYQRPSLLVCCAPVLPLALGLLIYFGGIQSSSFLFINQITQNVPDRIWAGLTFLGNGWGTFALAFPLLLLAPRLLSAGIFAGLLGGLAIAILKPLVNLPRPASVLASGDFHQIGEALLYNSMPSGHTLTAFAVASGLYFACEIDKRKPLLCLFALASLVGLSRSAVGAHWLSDEFVAAAIGLWCGILGSFLASLIPDSQLFLSKWWPRFIALCGLLTIYPLLTQTMDSELNHSLQYACALLIAITLALFVQAQRTQSSR
ncbi:phosphatase PAP2 family protein [Polynucleobacter paneuropaeus]|uniref:Phosphatase PAP2 family protein n=1 Tax=Polynucleobacter paneuropaeus TaxID=2527775 RepID=A0A9Q2WHH8_9BURK|nr:phosphatase PAP2 family protein [Polynucleobacter paneuropaeus]MBT8531180.1 phosphatase PAP2 family protein [Polynucleobacter paneuropaeus]MBT8550560.1 phosphatase PAP2 family protein [Polynucleobacter paneuropaeus]MBT8556164.1 phosphatase PAP2 family protein [Polynucleobacter paneuropaeus]MBT8561784.1 phosphatase PAP2 family protein [Polynucleobacter paneuropaeus]